LRGVSTMAEGLGSALLFEGVETEEELHQALDFGARYIQGWYFSKAAPDFLPELSFAENLKPVLRSFGNRIVGQAERLKQRIRKTMETLGRPPTPIPLQSGTWGYGPTALDAWVDVACRVFLTDQSGFQVSPNFETSPEGWKTNPAGLGRCRSIRPYFPGSGDSRWSVSDAYYDVNDRSLLRTYTRPTEAGLVLFVDVLEIENQG